MMRGVFKFNIIIYFVIMTSICLNSVTVLPPTQLDYNYLFIHVGGATV